MGRTHWMSIRHSDIPLAVKSYRAGTLNTRTALASWIGISLLLWAVIIAAASWLI
jgi:hypothetical protein